MYFKTSDGNEDVIPLLLEATVEIVNNSKHANHPRIPNRNRSEQKLFWSQGYSNWLEEEFKDRLYESTSLRISYSMSHTYKRNP